MLLLSIQYLLTRYDYYTYFPSIQHRNYITRKTFQIFVRARSNFALHSIIDDQPHFSQNHSLEFPAFFPHCPPTFLMQSIIHWISPLSFSLLLFGCAQTKAITNPRARERVYYHHTSASPIFKLNPQTKRRSDSRANTAHTPRRANLTNYANIKDEGKFFPSIEIKATPLRTSMYITQRRMKRRVLRVRFPIWPSISGGFFKKRRKEQRKRERWI